MSTACRCAGGPCARPAKRTSAPSAGTAKPSLRTSSHRHCKSRREPQRRSRPAVRSRAAADAVVMREHTQPATAMRRCPSAVAPGQYVSYAGSTSRERSADERGTIIGSREIGIAPRGLRIAEGKVARKRAVAVTPRHELVQPGEVLAPARYRHQRPPSSPRRSTRNVGWETFSEPSRR